MLNRWRLLGSKCPDSLTWFEILTKEKGAFYINWSRIWFFFFILLGVCRTVLRGRQIQVWCWMSFNLMIINNFNLSILSPLLKYFEDNSNLSLKCVKFFQVWRGRPSVCLFDCGILPFYLFIHGCIYVLSIFMLIDYVRIAFNSLNVTSENIV